MAVAVYNAGTAAVQATPESWLNASCSIGGSNQALLLCLQLYPSGSAPTGVTAAVGGTGMSLIEAWTSSGVYHYLFAILNPANGTANCGWTNTCYAVGQISCLTDVDQGSVAAAFTNVAHASGTSTTPSVTLASATGNLVAGHFSGAPSTTTINDSTLFGETAWGSGSYESCGSYAAGAASVTLDLSLAGSVAWSAQAVNVVAVGAGGGTTVQGSAVLAAAAALAANATVSGAVGAVAFESGVVDSDRATGTSTTLTVTPNGSANQVLLGMLQLDPLTTPPSLVTANCTAGDMTLIHSDTAGTVHFYMFGRILGATSASQTVTFLWDQPSTVMMAAAVFSGAVQTSVAAAFTNAASNNGLGGASFVTVASATNNLVVGHVQCGEFTSAGDTLLFSQDEWPTVGPIYDSAGSYAAGAAGVTLEYSSSGGWRAQGVNIVAAPVPHQGSATFAAAAGIAASGRLSQHTVAALAAAGALSSAARLSAKAAATLAGAAALQQAAFAWLARATLQPAGALTASATVAAGYISASASLAAAGSLSAAARLRAQALALLPGVGGFTAATVEPGAPTLLLHCDGADASTTFVDSSGNGHTVTAFGNAQVDTAQSKFGGASALFDGTDDTLLLPTTSAFAFGTGDFTIDFWIRPTADGTYIGIDFRPPGGNGLYPTLYWSGGILRYYINATDVILSSSRTWAGNWWHIALTQSSNDHRLFVNGVQEGSTANYGSLDYLVGNPTIGGTSQAAGAFSIPGWIDEVRIVKGTAAWTANFTPPTSPYADAFAAQQLAAQLAAVGALQAYAAQQVAARSTLAVAAALQAANVYIIQAWAGSATLAGAGALAASAGLHTFMGATVDARGGLTATTFSPKFAAAMLSPAGALVADAFAFLTITFRAAGGLAASGAVNLSPPFVGPTHLKGTGIYEALYTNLNSQMEVLVASGTLVGRTSPQRGDAEVITIGAPLKLQDGKLSLDIDELKDLLGLP